jgi:hypothetical protein
MVRDLAITDQLITAKVRGTEADDYQVQLDLADPSAKEIVGRCTCPHYEEGFLCKHIWAVLLANDNNKEAITSPRHKVTVLHDFDLEDEDGELEDGEEGEFEDEEDLEGEVGTSLLELLPPSLRSAFGISGPASKPKRPTWRNQFDSLANGEWGKFKRFSIRSNALTGLTSEQDKHLLGVLIGNEPDEHADTMYGGSYYGNYYQSYRGFNRSWVRSAMYDWLLPQLSATNRFAWSLDSSVPMEEARPVVWDDGPHWRCRIRLETAADAKCWRVVGDLTRFGAWTRP